MVDENFRVQNALYGHKTDLKELFSEAVTVSDGEVSVDSRSIPRWIRSPSSTGDVTSRIEMAIRDAKRFRSGVGIANFEVKLHGNRTPAPPKKIQEKLQAYMDSEFEQQKKSIIPENQGFRHSFFLIVEFGKQGGPKDLYIDSHFKN
jgi:hypothetical protein